MSGQVLTIIDAGAPSDFFDFMGKIMEASSVIVPRLDLLTQSAWLIHGPDQQIGALFIILHSVLFLFVVGCAAIFDLLRKEF
jgi:hypothetical protein